MKHFHTSLTSRYLAITITVIAALLWGSCSKDELATPSDLVFTVEVSDDGSGLVNFQASAEHAKYYTFDFGASANETPLQTEFGSASYVYAESGHYTASVKAHADENLFISDSKEFQVDIFVNIPSSGYSTPESYEGMAVVWADEFEADVLDESVWKFEIGDGCPNLCGWGNNELEYYKKENTQLLDGYLVIEARKETAGSKSYTSSRIITKDNLSVKYGRIDVRAVMPKGQGLWPAIWLLGENIDAVGWPACGEIDLMEMIGGESREKTVHGTVHWDHVGNYASYGGSYTLTSGTLADEFHVFSIEWDENFITWYIDDIQYHIIDITPVALSEFRQPFFFIMNVAVGGNWPGTPFAHTLFPQRMIVDYIRVFQNE